MVDVYPGKRFQKPQKAVEYKFGIRSFILQLDLSVETNFKKASKMENTSNGQMFAFLEVVMPLSFVEIDGFLAPGLELLAAKNRQYWSGKIPKPNFVKQIEVTLVAVS